MIKAGINLFIGFPPQAEFSPNVKYVPALAGGGGPACYLCDAMCIHLDKFRIYWAQFPAENIIVHLYSAQQTQKKANAEIMQYASGAAPPGAGFLPD